MDTNLNQYASWLIIQFTNPDKGKIDPIIQKSIRWKKGIGDLHTKSRTKYVLWTKRNSLGQNFPGNITKRTNNCDRLRHIFFLQKSDLIKKNFINFMNNKTRQLVINFCFIQAKSQHCHTYTQETTTTIII